MGPSGRPASDPRSSSASGPSPPRGLIAEGPQPRRQALAPLGKDRGASPYDYLLAGLGACTSMTLRMYADRKKWPLEHVRVQRRHDRIHAKDCEQCESDEGMVDEIERIITLTGEELDDAQHQRLLEIADKCPVHRTLMNEKVIPTRLDVEANSGAD
jgi:uncharacterized OsmC-like protein